MKLTTKQLRNIIKEELGSLTSPSDSLAAMGAADAESIGSVTLELSGEEAVFLKKLLAMGPGPGEGDRTLADDILTRLG